VRVRRSLLHFGTSVLLLAVTMAVALRSTPLLVGWLGDQRFGGYQIILQGYGYLTLLELGLGGALGPLLARSIQDHDERALRRTVAAGARAYFRVALVSIAFGLALTPAVHLLARDLTGPAVDDFRRAWVVGLASFLVLVLVPSRTLVEARQSGYVVNLLLTGQSLLVTGLSLLLAWAGWGITGQAVAQAAGVWVFSLAATAVALRPHPGLLRAVFTEPVDPDTRKALRHHAAPNLLLNVSGRVSLLTDSLVVGGILGTRRVTSLVNTQKLVVLGQTILQTVGNASWVALAELHAQGERDTFNRRLVEMTRIVAVLAAVGLVPVLAFNRAFVARWLGPGFPYGGDLVVVVAAVNAVLLAEQSLWAWCFTATGKLREVVASAAVAAAINLPTSIILTYQLGVVGPLLGSTVAFVTVGLWYLPWRLRQTFGTPPRALLSAAAVPTAVGGLAAAALWWMALGREPQTWAGITAAMGLTALGMLAFSVAFLLTPADRALWRQRLAAVLPRRQPGTKAVP
jgi:O-antigen/teichoic acid export membrane protein